MNRKWVQRVMRAHRLLQQSANRTGVDGPGSSASPAQRLVASRQTKVWTAQHGWVYLHAIIDCCTREITGWSIKLRCRTEEAVAVVDAAVTARAVPVTLLVSSGRSCFGWVARQGGQGCLPLSRSMACCHPSCLGVADL
ncbi:MAG: hypothetical protein AB7O92_08145 [Acidimicrobiia bacterium]